MSIGSKLTMSLAVSAGFLILLSHSIPQADSDDAAKPTGLRSQSGAGQDDSPHPVPPVADSLPNGTDAFTSMRAALAIAKLRARAADELHSDPGDAGGSEWKSQGNGQHPVQTAAGALQCLHALD